MSTRAILQDQMARNNGLTNGGANTDNLSDNNFSATSIAGAGSKEQLQSIENFYIPYRDSKLTRILATHLGQNSVTGILLCLHPGESFIE